jgi:8-oxo-dGTP diphosphatase
MTIPIPLRRAAYRCAYALLRLYWYIVQPQVRGALALLIHGDQLLLIRNTYGRPGWTLPGGMMKRSEEPVVAMQREIHEEVGITPEVWQHVGTFTGRQAYRRDTIYIFVAQVPSPTIQIDPGEILDARWFPLTDLPPLSTYAQQALAMWQGKP